MSHTWIYSWRKIKVVFFNFFFIFARFGGFVSAVSVVSLVSVVSVVSFRSFGRFVSLFRVLVHATLLYLLKYLLFTN